MASKEVELIKDLGTYDQRLLRHGALPDGSFNVSIQLRLTPTDLTGLRAHYLIDSERSVSGETSPDWGAEAAVVQHVAHLLALIQQDNVFTFGQSDVQCGEIVARVPPIRK